MFYVNVMKLCKGNINAYINFDTIYLAIYFSMCVTLQLSSSPFPPVSLLFYLSIRSEEVLLYFSSCFWFTPETKNRMEINL